MVNFTPIGGNPRELRRKRFSRHCACVVTKLRSKVLSEVVTQFFPLRGGSHQ